MAESSATEPANAYRSFHIVTKLVGSRCNFDCVYCYYSHKEELVSHGPTTHLSEGLLDAFVREYITGQDADTIVFNWHGGEPSLMGLDFFRNVVRLQRKYADGKQIENDLQTNGSLLDESWCEFLKEHGFRVGLSIDGPKHLHDQVRRFKDGSPTFDVVYRTGRLLRQYDVPFNALTVVSAANARHPDAVYQFLTEDLGCRRLQWLPCVASKDFHAVAPGHWDTARMPSLGSLAARPGHPTSVVTEWSVDPDDWGYYLCRTFDLWLKDGYGKVMVNWFESLVGQWMGRRAQICSLAPVCGRSLVTMERDGSLYSCDHFVYPEYKLGNLTETDRRLADIVYSPQQQAFGYAKRSSLPAYCQQCFYSHVCHGECPKNRFIKTPDGEPGLNYLCSGIGRFLKHAEPHLRRISDAVR